MDLVRAAVISSECVRTPVIGVDTDVLIVLLKHVMGSSFAVLEMGNVDHLLIHCMIN